MNDDQAHLIRPFSSPFSNIPPLLPSLPSFPSYLALPSQLQLPSPLSSDRHTAGRGGEGGGREGGGRGRERGRGEREGGRGCLEGAGTSEGGGFWGRTRQGGLGAAGRGGGGRRGGREGGREGGRHGSRCCLDGGRASVWRRRKMGGTNLSSRHPRRHRIW